MPNKTYYDLPKLAPYLIPEDQIVLPNSPQEADAAAGGGGLQQRVSSLSNMLRGTTSSSSNPNLLLPKHSPSSNRVRNSGGPSPIPEETINNDSRNPSDVILPDWKLKDDMKRILCVGLVLATNFGTDPPDSVKPHPCAVLQCWMDPTQHSRSKATQRVMEALEQQYSVWSPARSPLKFRRTIDPTIPDIQYLCQKLRTMARSERVLFHYNGHGVPIPTIMVRVML